MNDLPVNSKDGMAETVTKEARGRKEKVLRSARAKIGGAIGNGPNVQFVGAAINHIHFVGIAFCAGFI